MKMSDKLIELRKEKGWTQNELGERLGVSNQAISKWESEMNMPDVMLLPAIADLFGCYIDELFQRNVMPEKEGILPLPWEDDDTVRCVVFKGHTKLASEDDVTKNVTFEMTGDALSVYSDGSITVNGNVTSGGCTAHGDISVEGKIIGECVASGSITVGDKILGTCTAGENITAGGKITGACVARNIMSDEDLSEDEWEEDASEESEVILEDPDITLKNVMECIEDTLEGLEMTLDSLDDMKQG